jgi:DNA-binding MarR family transcriptional regulator
MRDSVELARDLRLAVGRMARRLRRMYVDAEQGLSFLELAVLQRLYREGLSSPGALAADEGVTSAAVAAALTHLEGQGMLTRQRAVDDGRRVVVTISAAGRRTLHLRESASIARIEAVLAEHLSAADCDRLARVIPILEKVANKL